MVAKISSFYRDNKQLVDKQYRLFKSKVNMTYKEMVDWKKNKCSRAASIKIDEVIDRVTRLLRKPKTTWTLKDFTDSKKVVSYISRATKISDSSTPAKRKWGCMKGKNFYALRNWAYDREKEKRKPRRNPDLETNGKIYRLERALWSGTYDALPRLLTYLRQGWICDDCGKDDLLCECEKCPDCNHNRCVCDFIDLDREESRKKVRLLTWKLAKENLNDEELKYFVVKTINVNHLSHFHEYPEKVQKEMMTIYNKVY